MKSAGTKVVHAHRLIAKTARDAAEQLYEIVMGDNLVRAAWKKQNPGCAERVLVKRFVDKNAERCVPFARATLTRLLSTNMPENLKAEIHEALCLDATLIRGRAEGQMIVQPGVGRK